MEAAGDFTKLIPMINRACASPDLHGVGDMDNDLKMTDRKHDCSDTSS